MTVRSLEDNSASTIITSIPPQQVGLPRSKITSKSAQSIPTARVSTGAVVDAARLGKMLVDMQEDVATAIANVSRCPLTTGRLFVGVSTSLGVLLVLRHGLGRAARGYFVTRTYSGSASPILLSDGSLPLGIPSTSAVALIPNVTGKCDVWVF